MLEEQLISEFGDTLRAEAKEKLTELSPDAPLSEDTSLAEAILGYLEEAGSVVGHDLCPHEDTAGHRPCRLIGYSLPEDSTRLELFTALSTTAAGLQTLPRKEVARLSGWAARFFEYAAKGDTSRFSLNPAAAEAASLISGELGRIEDVIVHVLTDAFVRDRVVDDIAILGRNVATEVWDLERLYRVAGQDVTRDRIEIDFPKIMGRPISCLEMKPRPSEYETYLLILPGNLVFKLYDQYGPRLFEFNVRSFLQAKGAVNKGIQKTVREQPGRFLAYNNGLTATADEIEVGTWHGETVIKRIKGLQIVNGAQTTASIHRAHRIDKLSVDDVAVSMKLTLVPPEKLDEFVPLIARFANTQNPIQVADLSASDRFHQQFESLSEAVWCPGEETRWFYERARGSYQVARNRFGSTPAKRREFDRTYPKSQHFGKTDLAKYLMTWMGEPHTVSKGAQKNYATFMFGLRERMGDDWAPDKQFFRDTIAKALLFKATQVVVRRAKLQSYGANVVTYLVAKLAANYGNAIDFDYLWDMQEISPELTNLIATWTPKIHATIVSSAGKRNVTEWCKKDGCWEAIQALDLPLPSPLPPEFSTATDDHEAISANAGTDENELITLCMSLDGAAWAKIVAWAASTDAVEVYDRQVAHTLSGYAIGGWRREPSIKQALRGVRVIKAAREAGIDTAEAA
ncbi:AIPR family protein [Microvirga sp. 3-52]|uniref:AIPR family protein n=1 Tax=Microvirga sp. 3-52 TaxID=2792425 RepID=UPI001ACEC08F|nr:AIPR family protein [Microvirga sp. 3-52]MBO1904027.1 AIPR family protein [Microvirga sp. 3-52]MBS7451638.1 AIPR family protein [Microvirga sp. 3-52]